MLAPHRARVVKDYQESEPIERMDLKACPSDLNPTEVPEHLWNELKVTISARQLQHRTTEELVAMLVQEAIAIPVRLIRNLQGRMRRLCQAFIDSHESHTRY
jgi:hypothetical protein